MVAPTLLLTWLCMPGGMAQVGDSTQLEGWTGVASASETESDARIRLRERRRERSPWIDVPEVTVSEALESLGQPGVAVLDVTCRERRSRLTHKIPGAVWRDCTRVEEWAEEYRAAELVLVYCA